MPGPSNTVADALSRYAYPASSAREDVSFHGSEEARLGVKKMLEQELRDRALVGLIRRCTEEKGFFLLFVGRGKWPGRLCHMRG